MGNYTSAWSQPRSLYLPSLTANTKACEHSDVSAEEESPEIPEVKLRELPSEVWADVIAFLPLQEKISLSCVSRRMRRIVIEEIIMALKKHTKKEPRLSYSFDESRKGVHLHRRITVAREAGLLSLSNSGLVLQLESYRAAIREEPRAPSSPGWDWWTLISCRVESRQTPHQVTIKTCEELGRLETLHETKYDRLKLDEVCLEGQEGLIRGYCQHDYKPITEYLVHLPASLRSLEISSGLLYLVSSYQNDLMGNGAIFASISRTCPLLDTLHMYFDTCKVSSYYRDYGVLGLDGFSGLTEFKFGGVWNSVSKEEFLAFVTRNPTLQIIDINLDLNPVANKILLRNTNLQIVRLRCSRKLSFVEDRLDSSPGLKHNRLPLGQCKKMMTFSWFVKQPNLKYLWIQCNLYHSIEQLLESLPLLKNLRILQLDEAKRFDEEHFYKIIEILPSLEVLGVPKGFCPHENFWISLLDAQFGSRMREVCFKFEKCSYRLPSNIDLIKNSLPVKLTVIEVD